jgi:hypothetical protein
MWAAFIGMSHPLFENSPQVALIERNQEIQTLAAHASHQAFAESIRLGRQLHRMEAVTHDVFE